VHIVAYPFDSGGAKRKVGLMSKILTDTSPEIRAELRRRVRAMSPEERLTRACDLSAMVRTLMVLTTREQFPADSEAKLKHRIATRFLGPELANRFYLVPDE